MFPVHTRTCSPLMPVYHHVLYSRLQVNTSSINQSKLQRKFFFRIFRTESTRQRCIRIRKYGLLIWSVFLLSPSWTQQLSRDIPPGVRLLCDKAAVFGAAIKETLTFVMIYKSYFAVCFVFAPDEVYTTETRNSICCVYWIDYMCLQYNCRIFNFQTCYLTILVSCYVYIPSVIR